MVIVIVGSSLNWSGQSKDYNIVVVAPLIMQRVKKNEHRLVGSASG